MNKKILEEVFKAGTNWGVTFSTWFTPTEEDHKKRFEEEVNKILSDRTSEVGVQPEVMPKIAEENYIKKLEYWVNWMLENCDDSPEWNFGTDATKTIRDLLKNKS